MVPIWCFADELKPTRTLHLDFDTATVSSPWKPRSISGNKENASNETSVLKPAFVEGIEGKGLRSIEPLDGQIIDISVEEIVSSPLAKGSIRFWFKPDWSTGTGPGGHGTFLSFGEWKAPPDMTGYWGLTIDPKGEHIQFGAQSKDQGTTFISASVQFLKGYWYEICLTYDAGATWLYIDGRPYGPGQGVSFMPSLTTLLESGFAIGNTPKGFHPTMGTIDGLEIFNFPLGRSAHEIKYYAVSASVEQEPLSVHLKWPTRKGMHYEISRRSDSDQDWQVLARDLNAFQYKDASADLQSGQVYEYRVAPYRRPGRTHQIQISALTPPIHQEGKILLMVDETLWKELMPDLATYKQYLELDGWQVVMERAPRHDDRRWKRNVKRISEVKEIIHEQMSPLMDGLKVVLLIGHVAVPYAGMRALDGHARQGDDHRGAWSSDAYYGDLDGVWRDRSVHHINRTNPPNSNVPGDGKFDEDYLPTSLEVAVGRIDFANLPALNGDILDIKPRRKSQLELAFIRQYIQKNMAYRRGDLVFSSEALMKSYLPSGLNMLHDLMSIGNASRWFGHVPGNIRTQDGFEYPGQPLWAFMAGRSGSASFADGRRRTSDFNDANKAPKAAFQMYFSSWHGDWNTSDSFLRASLATPSAGLAAMSLVVGPWYLGDLGRGQNLAYAYLKSANQQPKRATRALAIMGDPTLKHDVLAPIGSLKVVKKGAEQTLTWERPDIPGVENIFIYRFDPGQQGFKLMDSLPPERSSWNLPSGAVPGSRWMIRMSQRRNGPSGSYAHLSHGANLVLP